MNTFEDLTFEEFSEDEERSLIERSTVMYGGEEMAYLPETPAEKDLLQKDFPKYSPEDRGILVRIREIIDGKAEDPLFEAVTEEDELSELEKDILKYIKQV